MRYEYDHFGMIVSVTDQNGIRYLKNSYDEKGRVTKQDIANGEEHVFLYRDADRQTIYINTQSGRRTIYHYNDKKQPTKTEYDDGTTKEFAYDQWGNKILEKSRDGSENRWTYRQDGKLLSENFQSHIPCPGHLKPVSRQAKAGNIRAGMNLQILHRPLGVPVQGFHGAIAASADSFAAISALMPVVISPVPSGLVRISTSPAELLHWSRAGQGAQSP